MRIAQRYSRSFLFSYIPCDMTIFTLKPDQICFAAAVSVRNFSIFRNPKAHIVCGNCKHLFITREYIRYARNTDSEDTVANCPNCNKWNKLNLIML